MKRIACLLAAASFLLASTQSRADAITGHFSIDGSIVNNAVYPASGPNSDTLTFTTITNGTAADSTGTFSMLLTPGESSTPSGGTLAFNPNGTQMYTAAYFNFGTGMDELLIQVLNLSESRFPTGNGFYDYLYTANVIFSTPGDSMYSPTDGNITFTTQDAKLGSVTFSATGLASGTTPEPSSLLLLATGLAGAAGMVRRRLAK